jgi:hypothetical protein
MQWKIVATTVTNRLRAVWGTGTDVWAVGDGGTILHNSGTGWQKETSGTSDDLYSVWGSGPTDVWAVGGGMYEYGGATVLHRDGNGWTGVETGTIGSLRAVAGGGGKVLVAGIGGTVLQK